MASAPKARVWYKTVSRAVATRDCEVMGLRLRTQVTPAAAADPSAVADPGTSAPGTSAAARQRKVTPAGMVKVRCGELLEALEERTTSGGQTRVLTKRGCA